MMRKIRFLSILVLLFLSLIGHPANAAPGDEVTPGNIRTDATFEHIGVLWWIEGDNNLNSSMSLEFRRLGDTTWRQGTPAIRAYPTIYVQDTDPGPLGLNYWAASALFLEPGQTYELRLTLIDPDGGSQTRTVTATTRTEPQPDLSGRQLYVVPGSGAVVTAAPEIRSRGCRLPPMQPRQAMSSTSPPERIALSSF